LSVINKQEAIQAPSNNATQGKAAQRRRGPSITDASLKFETVDIAKEKDR